MEEAISEGTSGKKKKGNALIGKTSAREPRYQIMVMRRSAGKASAVEIQSKYPAEATLIESLLEHHRLRRQR